MCICMNARNGSKWVKEKLSYHKNGFKYTQRKDKSPNTKQKTKIIQGENREKEHRHTSDNIHERNAFNEEFDHSRNGKIEQS